jgi:hypothetical protein
MKTSARPWFAALAASGILGAFTGPALADDPSFHLNLTGPTTGVAGEPMVFTASGGNPPVSEYDYPSYLDAVVVRPSAISTCPSNAGAADQAATATFGGVLAYLVDETEDANGNWSLPVGFTPASAGPVLLCAYTSDLGGLPMARASMTLNISPASGTGGGATGPAGGGNPAAAPANTKKPTVRRAGRKLVCSPGNWTGKPGAYKYDWLVGSKQKPGRKLGVTRGLRGRSVQCRVTAFGAGGSSSATSKPFRVR